MPSIWLSFLALSCISCLFLFMDRVPHDRGSGRGRESRTTPARTMPPICPPFFALSCHSCLLVFVDRVEALNAHQAYLAAIIASIDLTLECRRTFALQRFLPVESPKHLYPFHLNV
ncbi:hypothetical protein HGRIS_002829 [Hohenbuehelia grisea]|uniref:Secreted protein n=1 Tax=Hohenbuehelia grisea TaxID=104357 RepID=A0ABR3JMD4_9AGAR